MVNERTIANIAEFEQPGDRLMPDTNHVSAIKQLSSDWRSQLEWGML